MKFLSPTYEPHNIINNSLTVHASIVAATYVDNGMRELLSSFPFWYNITSHILSSSLALCCALLVDAKSFPLHSKSLSE
ncbi:CLUMA_CG016704, isoform A [Clunio marinus]|uniref:CLUMA_CG016704, isoform A n=1 Tax=Clunio marinus TaxID=568069 RepID=A0A1J1IVP1_9DIPT|nr:CLUMA_CG016704, isoform A [Clunio marinus]